MIGSDCQSMFACYFGQHFEGALVFVVYTNTLSYHVRRHNNERSHCSKYEHDYNDNHDNRTTIVEVVEAGAISSREIISGFNVIVLGI